MINIDIEDDDDLDIRDIRPGLMHQQQHHYQRDRDPYGTIV